MLSKYPHLLKKLTQDSATNTIVVQHIHITNRNDRNNYNIVCVICSCARCVFFPLPPLSIENVFVFIFCYQYCHMSEE